MEPSARRNRRGSGWAGALSGRLLALGVSLMVVVSGCQVSGGPVVLPARPGEPMVAPAKPGVLPAADSSKPAAQAQAPTQAYTAKLQLTPSRAEVGATVQISGSGYPAGADVELVWHTVDGRYELEGGTEFVGQRFDLDSRVLTTVRADPSGVISTQLQVPLDYGGSHDLRGRVNGEEISQAGLTIEPTFSLTPREGPVGTPIELRIVGVDFRANINTWHVLYDNRYLGFMSAVKTKGIAVAHFRASGPVGERRISVWHNSFNAIPYLNWQQGPYKDVPGADFTFQVTTDSGLPAVGVEDFSATDTPWPVDQPGPGTLSLSVDRGAVGQPVTLRGSALPPNTSLGLRWWTMVGNRVSSIGFSEDARMIGSVQTGPDGAFEHAWTILDDLGGQHRLDLMSGDRVLASAGLVIQPSVVALTPTRVRAGDEIKVHLKGVGWTTYDNTYAVTYDNSYVGYVCGFSTNGDVQFSLTATGARGTHIIDLYPTVYKGKDAMPRIYSVPQLTYADDHPQRSTPAIRLAVEIVE